jgi:phosphate transport system substrate-binding protein
MTIEILLRSLISARAALCIGALFSATAALADSNELKLSVAKTAEENILSKVKVPFEKLSGLKIVYVQRKGSEAHDYFNDVVTGKADAAIASQPYDVWEAAAKNAKIAIPSDMTHRVIGKDVMKIITNKSSNIKHLSMDQLTSVFMGQAKSWKEVGGSDSPITIVTYANKQAKNKIIEKILNNGHAFGGATKGIEGEEGNIVNAVKDTPGAIGFLTLDVPLEGTQEVETPPIGRPITLITKGAPTSDTQKLISFIRTDGGKLGVAQ